MNDKKALYQTKTKRRDGFVIQEITLVNKLYDGLKAIAEAEGISVDQVISNYIMAGESCFSNPNYPK